MIKDSVNHKLTSHDFDRMAELFDNFGKEVGQEIFRYDREVALKNILIAYEAGNVLVVWDEDWRAAIISLIHPSLFADEVHAAEIAFVVQPAYRSKGIGPRVLLRYETVLPTLGVKRSCIASSHPMYHREAGRLYERLGYRQTAIGYQKDL